MLTHRSLYTGDVSLHIIAEHSRKRNSEAGVYINVGVLVRTALQMGYHRSVLLIVLAFRFTFKLRNPDRDSSHYPELSPFAGELRRHAWSFIVQVDALPSFQTNLPSMIYGVITDTAKPRNLHDWEFSKDMIDLPPSRPPGEETPVAYTITKARLLVALGKIARYLTALQPISWETVMQLDNGLLQAHMKVPPHLAKACKTRIPWRPRFSRCQKTSTRVYLPSRHVNTRKILGPKPK
jgi:hypothetical protein